MLLTTPLTFFEPGLGASVSPFIYYKSHNSFYRNVQSLKKANNHSDIVAKNKNRKRTVRSDQTEKKEGAPWSNAFNFKKIWGTQVNPRTGTLSAHIKAGSLLSNLGHGPNIDLELNYNSIATADPDKLGAGWSWNLTHFNPVTNQLSTSFGQSFYLQQNNNGQWYPLYHKLHDILIRGDKTHHFVITYANGLRETLNHEGNEISLEQQDGWRVHFIYVPGTHLLQTITDDMGHCILLNHKKNHVAVISKGSSGQPVTVLINKENGEPHRVILPSQNKHQSYDIRFTYRGHLIAQVNYPTGLEEKFTYNCKDEMKLSITGKFSEALCVVIHKIMNPGAEQPVMEENYQYGKNSNNEHNYLGFNSGLSVNDFNQKDILFEAPVSYTYRTQEDNGIVREIRTYNKYHLLIDDQRISDRTGKKLSETHNFFCRADQENGCAHSSFEDLPATYSQPLKVVTFLWGKAPSFSVTKQVNRYNQQGRIVYSKNAYGRVTKMYYCPVTGDKNCPAAPDGWNFSTLVESIIVYPAITDTTIRPPVIIHNAYLKQFNHNGHGYILVLDHQIQQAGEIQTTAKYRYYQDTDNALTYGLLRQTIVKDNLHLPSRLNNIVQDYYYTQSTNRDSKTTYIATELRHGSKRLSSSVTTSLFTNHPLQRIDPSGQNMTRYHYDLWDRPVQTDFAVGTAFATSNYYQYTVSPIRNEALITTANGLQEKIIFDGAGRIIKRFREALTAKGKAIPGHWIQVSKTTYDQYGRIAIQSVYITGSSGKTEALTTTSEYDDSGRVTRVHLPDRETVVTQYDDANRCVVSYRQSCYGNRSVISVTRANVLYKPIKQWVYPASYKPLPSPEKLCTIKDSEAISHKAKIYQMTYDGFSNIVISTDPLGHVVKKQYDALGRLTDTTDPVGDKIHNVYDLAGHVIQRWAQPASGGNYLLFSAEYNAAGELLWQAGEDRLRTTFTYTKTGKLATATTPAGHVITLRYNILGFPVTELIDGKIQLQTTYNPVNLLIKERTDITGKTHFTYGDDGLIQYLFHSGNDSYNNYTLKWKYDKNRRIVSVTDIRNNQTQTLYDTLGRVSALYYQPNHGKTEVLSIPVYDDLSRVIAIRYGSGMQRNIHYDTFENQSYVADILNRNLLLSWSFYYDANGNITTLVNKKGSKEKAIFRYQYDALNNLVSMTCDGSSALPLCPRDTAFSGSGLQKAPVITRQDYHFTPLNRLAVVRETLQTQTQYQTVSKLIAYQYTNTSVPLRLQSISTHWNHQSPKKQNFSYDVMGNMTTDGEGNHILYNAFNQVIQVKKPSGQRSYYTYDGTGKEIGEKNNAGSRYLFYRDNELINERISLPGEVTHIKGYHGVAETMDDVVNQYNESNYKGDIIGIIIKASAKSKIYKLHQLNIYSPYGMQWHYNTFPVTLYQQTSLGFDGERTDPATGWQFLGKGYRTYNPEQRYFLSEDPAGGGYSFGSNNPIMNSDPSGNMPQWLGVAFRWSGYISSFGLTALHKKWANIAGAVITAGLTIATLGASAYTYGGTLAGSVVTAGTTTAGVVPVVAAAIPSNRGLNIAASVIGITEMTAMVATAAVDMGLSFFSPGTMTGFNQIRPEFLYLVKEKPIIPLVKPFDPVVFFLRKLPHMVLYNDGNYYLDITNFNNLCTVWTTLQKQKNGLITCDTMCMLIAAQLNEKYINLAALKIFLDFKFQFWCKIKSAPNHTLGSFEERLYLSYFRAVLERLSNNAYHDFLQPATSLEEVLPEPCKIAAVIIDRHVQVIVRATHNIWAAYTNINGDIKILFGFLHQIDQLLFSYMPCYGERFIRSYIILK